MRLKYAFFAMALAASTTQAQAPSLQAGPLIGRITATAHLDIFQTVYAQKYEESGSPFVASAVAAYQMKAEAEERLSLAMEAFRWKDPEFFRQVMESYGLGLTEK